jgi:hypothetical protein
MSQIGEIPATATGLRVFGTATVDVFINGQRVGGVDVHQNTFPIIDVSNWSGRTVNLEFRFQPDAFLGFDVGGFTSAPEPSTWALFGLGAGVIGWQAWRRQTRS